MRHCFQQIRPGSQRLKCARVVTDWLSHVISFRLLNQRGPCRASLLKWASGEVMAEPMLLELLAYSTGLVVMQRLESRHSLLKRFLAWRHKQMPATLSAALRRRENKDLESDHFRACLPDLLSCIGELDPEDWTCKTEFLERFSSSSACALHDPLTADVPRKELSRSVLQLLQGTERVQTFLNCLCYASTSEQCLRGRGCMHFLAAKFLDPGRSSVS